MTPQMTIAQALALVQADAEKNGYKLRGPNFATKEGAEPRNLYQEAQDLAKAATGKPPQDIAVTATATQTAAEVAQSIVEVEKEAMGLPSIQYKPKQKLAPWVLPVAVIGAAFVLYLVFRPAKKGFKK